MTASRTLPHTAPFEHVREPELEQRLARHYDELRGRDPVPTDAAARHRLAALMAHEMSAVEATGTAEAARQASAAARATGARATPGEAPASTRRAGLVALLATQARFISPLTWVAQLGLALLAALVAALDATGELAGVAVPVIGAAMVLTESPALLKSKRHGVDELEYSCPLDCRGVLLARMIVLGCSGALALTCMAVAVPLAGPTTSPVGVTTPLATLVHSCVPYFLGCVGSLVAVRRASAGHALALAAVSGHAGHRRLGRAAHRRACGLPECVPRNVGACRRRGAAVDAGRGAANPQTGKRRARRDAARSTRRIRSAPSRLTRRASKTNERDDSMELTLDRLTRQFGAKIAVDRVSATLGPGVYGLLGANGAGKTTAHAHDLQRAAAHIRADPARRARRRRPGRRLPGPPGLSAAGLRLLPRLHRLGLHALHGRAQGHRAQAGARALHGTARAGGPGRGGARRRQDVLGRHAAAPGHRAGGDRQPLDPRARRAHRGP